MIASGESPPQHDFGGYGHLLAWLLNHEDGLGPIRVDGMGNLRALDWPDITHFQMNLKLDLSAWEAGTLKAMSLSYLLGNQLGTNPLARSPTERGNQ